MAAEGILTAEQLQQVIEAEEWYSSEEESENEWEEAPAQTSGPGGGEEGGQAASLGDSEKVKPLLW